MSRAKPRGSHGAALFEWRDPRTGDVQAAEVADNPLTRRCPTCSAGITDQCTRPSRRRGGRVKIRGYHPARKQPSTGASTCLNGQPPPSTPR